MATRRNFPGELQATLEGWLRATNLEIATGKVNAEFAAGDTNFKAMVDSKLSAERRRDLIYADLNAIDSTAYPLEDDDGNALGPVRITAARFVD